MSEQPKAPGSGYNFDMWTCKQRAMCSAFTMQATSTTENIMHKCEFMQSSQQ